MRIVSALALAGLVATFAPAATYYVDQSHPQASDFNAGSEAAPWKTIQHAATILAAGDTVYVKTGTYAERVIVANDGAAGQEIVLAAYPGHTVTISGQGIEVPEYAGLVEILGRSHIRLKGFHVTNAGPHPSSTGIQVEDSSRITIESNHTSQTASSGILIWNSSDILVDGNDVESPMTTGLTSRNECITVGRTTRFEIRNNQVHDNPQSRGEGICLKDGSTFGSAHHNHVSNVPSVGIYIDAWTEHTHDIDVYANRVHNVRGSGIVCASEQGGLLEHIRIFNNLSHSNETLGFDLSNCCIAQHPMSDIRILNNSFWNNGVAWGGGLAVSHTDWTALLIRNNAAAGNLSFEMAAEGIDVGAATIDHNLVGANHEYPGEFCGASCQVGDPLWVNPAGADFHLLSASPAIDVGSATGSPANDLEGNPRPRGCGHDIGAYELVPAATIPAPASITATAATPSTVSISWSPVSGAVGYDVARSANGSTFFIIGSTASTSLSDSTASPNTAYLYRVIARDAACSAGTYSANDLATTTLFTDDALPGITIKALHITELRAAVNAVRALAGLAAGSFTDPTLTAGVSAIRAVHLSELRARLDQARSSLGLPALSYTDPTLIAGSTPVRAAHVSELRQGSR